MVTLRVYQVGLAPVVAPTTRLRIYEVGFTSTAIVPARLRIFKVGMNWTPGLVLAPFADVGPVEPETAIELVANLVDAPDLADTYTWRQISGPPVSLPGTGRGMTFITPSLLIDDLPSPCEVVIGVRATKNGVTSPEQTCKVKVYPNGAWTLKNGVLVGRRRLYPVTGE